MEKKSELNSLVILGIRMNFRASIYVESVGNILKAFIG